MLIKKMNQEAPKKPTAGATAADLSGVVVTSRFNIPGANIVILKLCPEFITMPEIFVNHIIPAFFSNFKSSILMIK
jgi:hypothetical protein